MGIALLTFESVDKSRWCFNLASITAIHMEPLHKSDLYQITVNCGDDDEFTDNVTAEVANDIWSVLKQ